MKTAYIFHDSFCDPFSEWYPWMKTTLEGMGYLVLVPQFPTPAGQSYESWKVGIKNHLNTFTNETVFVGHGTGGLFAMRLAQESSIKIHALFLIAGYGEAIGNIGYDRINKTFYEPAFDWEKIKSHVATIRVFAGEQDPFVPIEISGRLADNLGEALETIPQGGHLGKAAGFTQLVPIAARIKESLSELDKSIVIEKPSEEEVLETFTKTHDIAGLNPVPEKVQPTAIQPVSKEASAPHENLKAHTMYQDLSKIVNSNQGGVASSLLTKARVDKANAEAASPASGRNIIYTTLSIITVAATIGIALFLAQKYIPVATIPPAPEVPSLIKAEEHEKFTFSNEPTFILDQKLKNIFSKPIIDDTIRDIYYIVPTGRASFPSLLKAFGVSDLPVGLAGEFLESEHQEPVFMHGLSVKNQVARHFLVVKVKDYDTTFALMKEWEPTMIRDLGPFMNISQEFLRTKLTKDRFQDELLQNKNVRVLRYHKPTDITFDEPTSVSASSSVTEGIKTALTKNPFANSVSPYDENGLMLTYFFLNEKTLIITDNLDIIPELLKRYANSQIYQ